MKRLFNSPLKVLGFASILIAAASFIIGGYFVFLGVYILVIAVVVYLIDFIVTRLIKSPKVHRLTQLTLAASYLLFCFWAYMKQGEHNAMIFPDNYKGQAGIIFGIEGFPPLEKTKFWKKTINIPDDGILITSTKQEEIPNTIRYYFRNGKSGDYNKIHWDPNFEYPCIVNNSVIKAWLFSIGGNSTFQVQKRISELANEINKGMIKSLYYTNEKVVTDDVNGPYLWLLDRNLRFLPDAVANLNVYKVVLTGNNFTEIPKQILSIKNLEDITIGHNPITEITPGISNVRRLKSLILNATKIAGIKTDLSQLDSLEYFDFSSNEASHLPEQVKNIPNLKWLSLDDNNFKDLSFVDARLHKLEKLYLYSNRIKRLSPELHFLPNLKELLIFDNQIDSIPDCISYLKNLEKLEIWDNPIKYISSEIRNLRRLRKMHMDDDYLTPQDKLNLKKWLPNCTITFQTRADKLK